METIAIATCGGDQVEVDEESLASFASGLRGQVLKPNGAGYDQARTIWNGMIDRRPGIIVQCKGQADVMRAVNFARERSLLLSVRGGGHNIAGNAVCEGGFMIDLSPMTSVRINRAGRRAYVEPGTALSDFDAEAQVFGLATPLGINSTTGVAGLALGGGFGWLTRKHGLTSDNLVAANVVTADGNVLRADCEQNADLFWALRGGGGNFGVVTSFEFMLHPVGPEVLAGLVVYPGDQAKSILARWREIGPQLPEEANAWVVLRKAPPLPFLPTQVHGKDALVMPVFYAGDIAKGEQVLGPLQRLGKPWGVHVGPMPYTAWQKAFDPLLTPGARNYWKSHNFAELTSAALDQLIRHAHSEPTPHCEIFMGLLGGQASRIPADASAYGNRDALFVLNVHGRWETPKEDEMCIAWARSCHRELAPFALGTTYINFMTEDEGGRVAEAYGTNYARLVEAKRKYDPMNLFRMNQNISPTGG